jgi:hypothetical protein
MARSDETGVARVGLHILALTVGILGLLGPHPARALSGSDFLPLELGNFWTYDQDGTSVTFTVTGVNDVGGTDVFDITQSGGGQSGDIENRSSDSNGVRIHGGEGRSRQRTVILDLNPPILDLPASFEIGDEFGGNGSVSVEIVGVGSSSILYTSSVSVLSVDAVTVPFGTFVDAILIESTANFGGQISTTREWRVAGLGPVKEVLLGPGGFTRELTATNVPEPGTVLLLGGGLASLAAARPRRSPRFP